MTKHILTQLELKQLLNYDPATGIFTWKNNLPNGILSGTIAGCDDGYGYIVLTIKGRVYRAHRLAFLYMEGLFPSELVDHKNNNRSDNRFSNLRKATHSQNGINKNIMKNNTSGFKGVSFCKSSNKWRARCNANGKRNFLGYYDTAELANNAYINYSKENHKTFHK